MKVLAWLPARLQDVRVAFRMFRHRPGFVGVAVLSLGIGIGLATSIFTVANAVLLRKLAVHDQNRIVVLWGESPDGRFSNWPVSPIAARRFAERSHALTDVAVFGFWGSSPVAVAQADRVVPLRQSVVSGNFFSVLGTTAAIGRTLLASDDVAGAAPVAVLSYGAWIRQFGADPAVLGRRLKLAAGPAYTVVGVMPEGIDYPHGSEFWVPITSLGADVDSLGEVDMVGRLAPGATAALSAQELSDFLRTAPSQNLRALRGVATTLPDLIIGPIRPAVIAFGAAVLLLLVITCTNVTNLLLVRGVNRVGEMAIRTALGASRRRLVAQLLTENALLAIGGGIAGVVIAWACTRGFVALAPAGLPRVGEVRLDAAAFAGAAAITVGTMLAAGLLPAIATARATSKQVLRSAGRAGTGRGSRGMSEALVAGQLALALVVLSSATVVLESLRGLETTNLAFNEHNVSVVDLTLQQGAYDSVTDQVRMLTRLVPAIEAVPGVQAASPVVADPFAEAAWAGRLFTAAQSTTERAKNPVLDLELVAPSYFRALGITIVHGRSFAETDREGTQPVVMLSESAAAHYWPGEDPIGKQIEMARSPPRTMTVVGIVPDTRYRDLRTPKPGVYFPLAQSFFPYAPMVLVVRSTLSQRALASSLTSAIDRTAPGVTMSSVKPFSEYMDGAVAQPRFNAFLLTVFAVAAALLAATGLLGIMAAMVRARRREFGVRMAIGATSGEIRGLVLRRAALLAGAGLVIGIVVSLVANRVLVSLLYEVSPTDPTALLAAAGMLVVFAFAASAFPARAGSRIQPIVALRDD